MSAISLGLAPILGDLLSAGQADLAINTNGRVDSLEPGQSGSSWAGMVKATRGTRHSFDAPVITCPSLWVYILGLTWR